MGRAEAGGLRALRQLLAGGAAMVVAGGFWPVIVALTPASDRPWISGTSDNSIWSLILGYNGLGRLTGQAGGPGGNAAGGGGPGGGVFGGETGWLRLLDQSMGGQAGWFLGFALVSGVAVLAASRLRRADARTGWLIAVGGAFLTTAVAFSFAQGIFHPYYVSLLAPFTAALVGAGAAQLAEGGTIARVLGPLAVLAGVAAEVAILRDNPDSLAWLPGVLIAAGVAAAAALAFLPKRAIALGAAHRRAADRARRLVGADARPRHERHVPRRRPADRGHGRRPGRRRARRRLRRRRRPGAPAHRHRHAGGARAARAAAACSAATAPRSPRRSPTRAPTAAARSPSPPSRAPARRSSTAPRSPRSAASPATSPR